MSKFRRKTFNNIRNGVANSIKNEMNTDGLDYSTTIGERYKREDIRIHVHLRGRFTNFCAIFQYCPHEHSDIASIRVPPPTYARSLSE